MSGSNSSKGHGSRSPTNLWLRLKSVALKRQGLIAITPRHMKYELIGKNSKNNFVVSIWYARFLLRMDPEFLLRKTSARLNMKIDLTTLHIHPGLVCNVLADD